MADADRRLSRCAKRGQWQPSWQPRGAMGTEPARQTSILSFVGVQGISKNAEVVDLFCGIGGFSTGAAMAGHRVVLAVDCNAVLLDAHARNHAGGGCAHVCAELPLRSEADLLRLLPRQGTWHLHGSPPCQTLSTMACARSSRPVEEGFCLVEWFLGFAQRCGCTTWSMEQVSNPDVCALLEAKKRAKPLKVDFEVVDAVDFGVPQHRRRIVAGSPALVGNLRSRRLEPALRRCVLDVIPDPPAPYLRNSLYRRPDPTSGELVDVPLSHKIRSVRRPAYTIMAAGHKRWCDEKGVKVSSFTPSQAALLQSFPASYLLPRKKTDAMEGVGNAVPPLLAKTLLSQPLAPSAAAHKKRPLRDA